GDDDEKALLLAVLGAMLAGCAHQPVYTAQYYRTHKAALKKENRLLREGGKGFR
ncbi:hypothetical protein GGI1_17708, partial [Acidithiobacillus sp. GGI-221]